MHCNTQHFVVGWAAWLAFVMSVSCLSTWLPCCNTLQHNAWLSHCNTLQYTTTYCNTLQHTATPSALSFTLFVIFSLRERTCLQSQHTATHCKTQQHAAAHCNTLQHTATHCNTLQHTTTHYNTLQHTALRTRPSPASIRVWLQPYTLALEPHILSSFPATFRICTCLLALESQWTLFGGAVTKDGKKNYHEWRGKKGEVRDGEEGGAEGRGGAERETCPPGRGRLDSAIFFSIIHKTTISMPELLYKGLWKL